MYNNKPNNQSTGSNRPANRNFQNHTNFIEALKSAGGSVVSKTAKGIANDLIGGTAKQMVDSVFGSNSQPQNQTGEQNNETPFDFAEFMRSSENKVRSQDRVQYEYEQTETVVFNRRQEEVDRKIQSIQMELKKLASEIVNLDQSLQSAIAVPIEKPGIYHLNFYEKLLTFIKQLRKRVAEARHWASMQSQRSQAKSYFWQQSSTKVSGTKFSQSHERNVATQTG